MSVYLSRVSAQVWGLEEVEQIVLMRTCINAFQSDLMNSYSYTLLTGS
jgi:hypothetical protein